MKFESAKDMYDAIMFGDLYNKELELYVFEYNVHGALCYYYIDEEEAEELREKSAQFGEYWGAFLGRGGYVLDDTDYDPDEYDEDEATLTEDEWYDLYLAPSYEFCERYYEDDGWEYC